MALSIWIDQPFTEVGSQDTGPPPPHLTPQPAPQSHFGVGGSSGAAAAAVLGRQSLMSQVQETISGSKKLAEAAAVTTSAAVSVAAQHGGEHGVGQRAHRSGARAASGRTGTPPETPRETPIIPLAAAPAAGPASGSPGLRLNAFAPRKGRIVQLACKFSGPLAGILAPAGSPEGAITSNWRLDVLDIAPGGSASQLGGQPRVVVRSQLITPDSWDLHVVPDGASSYSSPSMAVVGSVGLPGVPLGAGQTVALTPVGVVGDGFGPGEEVVCEVAGSADSGECRVVDLGPAAGGAGSSAVSSGSGGFLLMYKSGVYQGGCLDVALTVHPCGGKILIFGPDGE